MATIEIKNEGKEYSFTLRSNAKEVKLDLTAYSEGDFHWSALSEQCKPHEKRTSIDIPECVSLAAKAKLIEIVSVSNKV